MKPYTTWTPAFEIARPANIGLVERAFSSISAVTDYRPAASASARTIGELFEVAERLLDGDDVGIACCLLQNCTATPEGL
jgi:hypothetical protein